MKKKIDYINCNKYRKLKNPEMSYIYNATIVLFIRNGIRTYNHLVRKQTLNHLGSTRRNNHNI